MRLQGLLHPRQFGGVFVFVVAQVVGFGFGLATPFAVVGRSFGGAIAFPADGVIAAGLSGQRCGVFVARVVAGYCIAVVADRWCGRLAESVALAD